MKLFKGTIRPGKVMEVLENGVIKASSPGLFSFTDDPEKLPPIMPWQIGSNCNNFSQPLVYDEVWIMNFADNPRQLYWFRKDTISNNKNIDLTEENVEILCNRNMDGEWATIYLSDGSGWIISKGESVIQIRPDGTIQLNIGFKHRVIDIKQEGISLGSENKSAHQAAYGDVVVEVLTALTALLRQIQMVSMPNPYTAAIGTAIMSSLPMIESKIPGIVSTHVSLD
jgi:hypothetical protein